MKLLLSTRRILAFPVSRRSPAQAEPEKDLQALLRTWTPREYMRWNARHGIAMTEALRQRWKCVRCREVLYVRLRRIALEEYAKLYTQAEEPQPAGLRRANREEVLS